MIADCLLEFLKKPSSFLFFFCNIDTGDKNYEMYMVSIFLIS